MLRTGRIYQIFLLLLMFVFLCRAFLSYDWHTLTRISFDLLCILMLFWFVIMALKFLYYRYILYALGVNVKLRDITAIYAIAVIAGFGIPFLASTSQVFFLKKMLAIELKKGISFSILEFAIRYFLMSCFAVFGFIVLFNISEWQIILGVLMLLLLVSIFLLTWQVNNSEKKMQGGFLLFISKIKKALVEAKKTQLCFACIISFLIYLVNSMMFVIILKSFNYQSSIFMIICIKSIALLAGAISLIPMGLGSRDLSVISLLVLIGIDSDIAISSIIIDRLLTTILPVILSVIIINIFFRRYNTNIGTNL